MKYLKHWKYQCLWAAPFIPWLLIHWMDVAYNAGLTLGWDKIATVFAMVFLTIFALIVFGVAYWAVHEND